MAKEETAARLVNSMFEMAADVLVCSSYMGNENALSEEERTKKISEYLFLHCEMEKFLYLTGATVLECKYGEKQAEVIPTDHNVQVDGRLAVSYSDCKVGTHIGSFGICSELTKKAGTEIKCVPEFAHGQWLNVCLGMKIGNESGVNKDSYLICTKCENAVVKPVFVPGSAGGENVRSGSASLDIFLKCWETGGIRPSLAQDNIQLLPEGEFAPEMYYDSVDEPTIGWGHLIEPGKEIYEFNINGKVYSKNLMNERITEEEAEYLFQKDKEIKQEDLNNLLDTYNLTTTQRQYDMLLSMTYNLGTGALTDGEKYKQTKRWFRTEGYKDAEYSKYVLGDITSGGKAGDKGRRMDELEILIGNSTNEVEVLGIKINSDYVKETGNLERIKSETGESIWNNSDKIDELREKWETENNIEYEEDDNED